MLTDQIKSDLKRGEKFIPRIAKIAEKQKQGSSSVQAFVASETD